MRGVYLLHFSPAYRHARHYVGYAEDIIKRVDEHRAGSGSRLTQVALQAGSQLQLVRIWQDADRATERRIKNWKNSPKLCPICNGTIPHKWIETEQPKNPEIKFQERRAIYYAYCP
jgi:predicted GIY-YIG superfamily endonuclease